MINVNEKLLDELNDSEFYLISKLMKYGKKSCPKNEVLMKLTKWGDNKVKKYKKSLIEKGFLISKNRWKILNGRRVRDSNQYTVNTKLISKYRGSSNSELYDFHKVEIHTDENEPNEFHIHDYELYENDQGIKVLKLLIIDKSKVLKKVSIGKSEPSSSLNGKESLKKDKNEAEKEKPKSLAKKVKKKHVFPDNTSPKSYDPLSEYDQRINKQLPFDVISASQTMSLLFPTKTIALNQYNEIYSEKAEIEIIEKSWKTFIEKRFSNNFAQVRSVGLLKKAFFEWTQRQVKFERGSKDFSNFKKQGSNNDGAPSFMLGLK